MGDTVNEAKMNELTEAEYVAYFRADLCCYSPEGYSLAEESILHRHRPDKDGKKPSKRRMSKGFDTISGSGATPFDRQ